ncbi:MAG: hypothetical protein ACREBE_01870, partial [bacterium]
LLPQGPLGALVWLCAVTAALRVVFFTAVETFLFPTPIRYIYPVIGLTGAAACFALSGAEPRLREALRRGRIGWPHTARRLRTLALPVASVLFSLALVEGVLRALDHPRTPPPGWRSEAPVGERNELGYRGQPMVRPDGAPVVVLLGDSQVEASGQPFAQLPEAWLQRALQERAGAAALRVFSVGARGYGTDQELLAIQEYLASRSASLVVLWETSNNDVWNNVFPTHQPWNGAPKPTFWLEDGRLRGPWPPPVRPFPPWKVQALLWRLSPPDLDRRWERTRLPPAYDAAPVTGPPSAPVATLPPDLPVPLLKAEKTEHAILLTPRSPRGDYGVALTHALMLRLKQEVELHGTPFVVFSTSSRPTVHDESVLEAGGRRYRLSSRQLWDSLDQIHEGIDFLEVPVTVPDALESDHRHLNARGNQQVMDDLARVLVESGRLRP